MCLAILAFTVYASGVIVFGSLEFTHPTPSATVAQRLVGVACWPVLALIWLSLRALEWLS